MGTSPLTPAELTLLHQVDGLAPFPPEAAAEVAALRGVGASLREALAAEVDVADDVMVSLALQDALAADVDVADDVMMSLALHDALAADVDVADDVMMSLALQDALAADVDVADDVMVSLALQDALASDVDVADDVMAALAPVAAPAPAEVVQLRAAPAGMPRWASLGGFAAVASLAAAVLFTLATPAPAPTERLAVVAPSIYLAAVNEAQVEDLEVADGTAVAVMQYEDGGPTVILVEDSES